MNAEFLREFLPDDLDLQITHPEFDPDSIRVEIAVLNPTAECPRCGQISEAVHSRYVRRINDLPCCGRTLVLVISVRKFRCGNSSCARAIFCERLPDLAAAYARTTGPLTESHCAIGMAVGGEPGARLADRLAMPTSPDTLLRRVKSAPDVPSPSPRYVGVDDWAWKKGHRYGTILIDLERQCVIDILPGRDGEALKEWLREHPEVEIISRDRWSAFADAAREAAPQAKQVADRWHLLKNLREALERLMERRHGTIREKLRSIPPTVPAAEMPAHAIGTPPPSAEATASSPRQQAQEAKRQRRRERFERVRQLSAEGHSLRRIATTLGMDRGTVGRYLRRLHCPDRAGARPSARMSRFRETIDAHIIAGTANAAAVHRELTQQSCRASYYAVRRYVRRRRIALGSAARKPGQLPQRETPSARRLSYACLRRAENRNADEQSQVRALHDVEELREALDLADEFMRMIRKQLSQPLAEWLSRAEQAACPEFRNFANGIRHDQAAVSAAMTELWSNGPVEGHVNRLKAIKRQMFGRAGFKLLRARVRQVA